jgi:hypothetical protein
MDAGRLAKPTRQPAVMPPASVLTTNIGSFSQPHWLLECFHQPLSLPVQTGWESQCAIVARKPAPAEGAQPAPASNS